MSAGPVSAGVGSVPAESAGIAGPGACAAARFATDFMPRWLDIALPRGDAAAPVIEGLGDDGPPTSLAQCRTIFMLAHLHLVTGRADLLDAARRVGRFALAHLRDDDGGFRLAAGRDGGALDDPASRLRRSYDQSFALLALATLHRADPSAVPPGDAEACWAFVEERLVDPATGALWEDDRGPAGSPMRAQNPHMHMLEALLQAFEMTGDRRWLTRARRFVAIGKTWFIDEATGAVREFVGSDLKPLADAAGRRREPGHQFEWAWLLRRYVALSGDRTPGEAADRMEAFAASCGVRTEGPMAGAPYDAVDADGAIVEATHLLWPLTEAGKLYAARADSEGDTEAAARARHLADLIFTRYVAPEGRIGWVNRLDGTGRVVSQAALTRLLYHVALFVTEGHRARLWTLDGPDGQPIEARIGSPGHH